MNRSQLHALLVQAKEWIQHTEFVIAPALEVELAAARKRIARHKKHLKLT